jgi:hypothetical protein
MAITVKHKFVSAIPDGADTSIVRPSNWNDDHDFTGELPVANGGTGASTLTGYVKGNGTSAMTATTTIPNTDISGLGTISTQNANAVAITGGTATLTSVTTPTVQATNSAGLSLKNSAGTTQMSMGAGGGDNLSINVSTNLDGANAQIDISPTGTGHVHIKPTGVNSVEIAPTNAGTMNNMVIGGTTPLAGSFTDFSVTGTFSLDGSQGTAGQVLTSAGTGATPTWTTPTGMTYPSGTGIAVVTSGSSWGTTLTAPSGAIVGTTDTQTLTNKRINLRVLSQTSTASLAINSDSYDQAVLTAQAVSLSVPAPTGTPVNGQRLTVRIEDNGGAQTISWTTTSGGWRVIGVTLPTTTVAAKVVYIGAIYNSDETFWDVVSVAQQA